MKILISLLVDEGEKSLGLHEKSEESLLLGWMTRREATMSSNSLSVHDLIIHKDYRYILYILFDSFFLFDC